jgi:hypothetical protein
MTKMNRRKHHRPVATRYNCKEEAPPTLSSGGALDEHRRRGGLGLCDRVRPMAVSHPRQACQTQRRSATGCTSSGPCDLPNRPARTHQPQPPGPEPLSERSTTTRHPPGCPACPRARPVGPGCRRIPASARPRCVLAPTPLPGSAGAGRVPVRIAVVCPPACRWRRWPPTLRGSGRGTAGGMPCQHRGDRLSLFPLKAAATSLASRQVHFVGEPRRPWPAAGPRAGRSDRGSALRMHGSCSGWIRPDNLAGSDRRAQPRGACSSAPPGYRRGGGASVRSLADHRPFTRSAASSSVDHSPPAAPPPPRVNGGRSRSHAAALVCCGCRPRSRERSRSWHAVVHPVRAPLEPGLGTRVTMPSANPSAAPVRPYAGPAFVRPPSGLQVRVPGPAGPAPPPATCGRPEAPPASA